MDIALSHQGSRSTIQKETHMLRWALIFFVISIIAALLGFTGIAGASAAIAKTLFGIAVVIFLVLLVLGLTVFRRL